MGQTPDELRREIEGTREHLGETLGAIEDRVSPRAIVQRRRSAVAERWTTAKETVMGRADHLTSTASGAMHGVTSGASGAVQSATGAVQSATGAVHEAPHMAASRAQGNPWAAGIIAFGAGMLAAALLPSTRMEEERAEMVMDKAKPLAEEAKRVAGDIASEMKDEGRSHVEALKSDASEAASAVTDTARSATQETRDVGRSAADDVRQTTAGGVSNS